MTAADRSPRPASTWTWRRIVILAAVVAVAIVLWARDRDRKDRRAEIETLVVGLIRDPGGGGGAPVGSVADELLRTAATTEIARLEPPVAIDSIVFGDDADRRFVASVVGAGGRAARFVFDGEPPRLIGVERIDLDDVFDESNGGSNP